MSSGALGRVYKGGDTIFQQGELGECMYVIQEGEVEVVIISGGDVIRLAILSEGDFFGEMALFEREVRSATVRALTEVRVITIDKKTFLRRIQADPSLAFRIVETMSHRVRQLNNEVVELKSTLVDRVN